MFERIKARLAWSDLQQLRDIIFVLSTQGWQKVDDDSLEAVERLVQQFSFPLESAGGDTCIGEIHSEFEAMLQYATAYISLSTLDYHAVWWHLYHALCASEWINALILVEILFSLPASNGSLERVFSQVNVIKSNKRTSLTNDTLDDLLMVSTMCSPLKDFNPNKAVDLWWREKVRRPNQKSRKQHEKRGIATNPAASDSESEIRWTCLTPGTTG